MDEVRLAVKKEAIPLVLGLSRKGIKVLDLAEAPNGLVTGDSGSGKSIFIRQMLTTLVALRSPEQMNITMFDLKNGLEMSLFENAPHVRGFAKDMNGLESTLSYVRDVMNDRGFLFERKGITDIHEYNRQNPGSPLPFHLVVVDEMTEIIDTKLIEKLIRRGRAYGIHLVVVTQKPELIKAHFPLVVRFKLRNGVNKYPIWYGRANVQFNGECTVQSLLLSREEAKAIIEENGAKKNALVAFG